MVGYYRHVSFYSFSTFAFSHGHDTFMKSNLSRLVTVVWVFTMLILVQSYSATLASMLTIKQLQPTFNGTKSLQESNKSVGYSEGSFFRNFLELQFSPPRLISYKSAEELTKLFENKTIAAAYHEGPYIDIFLAYSSNCGRYFVENQSYGNGFGFVFPLSSPLVADVSRAILKVRAGEEMKPLHNKYFASGKCHVDPTAPQLNTSEIILDIKNLEALFITVVIITLIALLVRLIKYRLTGKRKNQAFQNAVVAPDNNDNNHNHNNNNNNNNHLPLPVPVQVPDPVRLVPVPGGEQEARPNQLNNLQEEPQLNGGQLEVAIHQQRRRRVPAAIQMAALEADDYPFLHLHRINTM